MEKLPMRSIYNIRTYLFLTLVAFSSAAYAQYDISSFDSIRVQFPQENMIKLSKKILLSVRIIDDKPKITVTSSERILYLKNVKTMEPVQSAYTSTFNELVSFEANSYVFGNNKYRKIPVKDYSIIEQQDDGTFYDDYKELVFTYSGVGERSVTELNTVHELHEPRFLGTYFLNEYMPVNEFELTVECDQNADIDLLVRNFNGESGSIKQSVRNGMKIYSLKTGPLKRASYGDYQPSPAYYIPHVIPIFRNYKTSLATVPVLENTADLYSWYRTFVDDIDEGVDHAQLKNIITQFINDDMNEMEKVKAIYSWVQANIKYIAFEDGMAGFVPRKPDEVLLKRYGDCKDKASLLHALLQEAGVTSSYLTWIGTTDIPYSYNEVPSPVVDNHMIVTCVIDSNYYFLDATGNHLPVDIPTGFIQGKEALIGISTEKYEIRKVPFIRSDQNHVTDTVNLELQGTNLKGQGSMDMSGLPMVDFKNSIDVDDPKEQKDNIERRIEKGNNKFVLTSYNLPSESAFSDKFRILYEFTIDGFAQSAGSSTYLNMNLSRFLQGYKLEKDRKIPVEFENTIMTDDVFILSVPQNYEVAYLPEDVNIGGEDYSISIRYEKEDNKIIYHQKVIVNKLYFQDSEVEAWNAFITDADRIYKENIMLKSIL